MPSHPILLLRVRMRSRNRASVKTASRVRVDELEVLDVVQCLAHAAGVLVPGGCLRAVGQEDGNDRLIGGHSIELERPRRELDRALGKGASWELRLQPVDVRLDDPLDELRVSHARILGARCAGG